MMLTEYYVHIGPLGVPRHPAHAKAFGVFIPSVTGCQGELRARVPAHEGGLVPILSITSGGIPKVNSKESLEPSSKNLFRNASYVLGYPQASKRWWACIQSHHSPGGGAGAGRPAAARLGLGSALIGSVQHSGSRRA